MGRGTCQIYDVVWNNSIMMFEAVMLQKHNNFSFISKMLSLLISDL